MRHVIITVLLVLTIPTLASAQILELGMMREKVMKIVYRPGAHADTLGTGSYLMQQVRMYPDTGQRSRYAEAIRVAPVRFGDLDGYGVYIFDSTGRLFSYSWMRRDMSTLRLGGNWVGVFTWRNDITHEQYLATVELVAKGRAVVPFTGYDPKRQWASSNWYSATETVRLNWNKGSLMFAHSPK